MTLGNMDLEGLVKTVKDQVLKNLDHDQAKQQKTLAVFAGYVFDEKATLKYLNDKGETDCVLLEHAKIETQVFTKLPVSTEDERIRLAAQLKDYNKIVLVTPPLALLGKLEEADESDFAAMLGIRPLLWGRDVTVLLDFEIPKRLNAGYAKIAGSIEALEKSGYIIDTIRQGKKQKDEAYDLVTEKDILDAARKGNAHVRAKQNAIITQLAQDTAKETGITIEMTASA